jgi:uncharacterized Zn finger protein
VSSRIGKGPWARAFGAALIPDESDPVAMAGRALVDAVSDLRIEPGLITARVGECTVTLSAPTIPPRIWAAMVSYARGRGVLERAVNGEVQSEQLMHLMAQDWDEPLIPWSNAVTSVCICDADGPCVHTAALVYAFAAEVDSNPDLVLRWRGCAPRTMSSDLPAVPRTSHPWSGGTFPVITDRRTIRATSIPRRLGPSGVNAGKQDLADALAAVYSTLNLDDA